MTNFQKRIWMPISLIVIILLNSCSGTNKNSPEQAVETYLQALVERDLNRMIAVSCAEWEPQAKIEFDSFAAVKLSSRDLECQSAGSDKTAAQVVCSGSIIANYGAEDLEIDVAERAFKVVSEGGESRMCGYSNP